MKRVLSCLICLLMLLALALPCAAAPADCVRLDTELNEDETTYLGVLFDLIQKTYGVEAFFLINYDYEGGDTPKTTCTATQRGTTPWCSPCLPPPII